MRGFGRLRFIKKPKVWAPFLVILVVAVAAFLVVHGLNAPAVGSIDQTPPAQAQTVSPYSRPGFFSGKYVSYSYPAHFKPVPAKLTGDYLQVGAYSAIDESGKQLNIGVASGSISSSSGVSYRRQHPELYKETGSRLGTEFKRLDGTEDTFFIEHNGLLATVSATAPNGGLDNEAFYVASSLRWK